MNKQTATIEVDGSKLRLAREAQNLTSKELALKVCLSKEHISQLENNQSVIFFTVAHKIQVAKKVGTALGLNESDYLITQEINEISSSTDSIASESVTPIPLPISIDLFTKANVKPTITKKNIFVQPTFILSLVAIVTGITIFSNDLSNLDFKQFVAKPAPLKPEPLSNESIETPPIENTVTELPTPLTPALDEEPQVKKVVVNNESIPCSYQGSGSEIYRTANPIKAGEMVYLLSRERQTVCVLDSQNKSFPLDLDAGQSRSIYGKAPFTVISSNLSKFDIYFQGWKVKMPSQETKSLRLEATELAQTKLDPIE
jgi:transcriptional regulator with XRE-family HTH domain